MAFTGTAIYVYCVLPRSTSNPNGNADMTFSLDNRPVGSFQRAPAGSDGYDYDVLVFSSTSLTNQRHHFFVSSGSANAASMIILDRIVYRCEATAINVVAPSLTATSHCFQLRRWSQWKLSWNNRRHRRGRSCRRRIARYRNLLLLLPLPTGEA
jgi:hypothetical protein